MIFFVSGWFKLDIFVSVNFFKKNWNNYWYFIYSDVWCLIYGLFYLDWNF